MWPPSGGTPVELQDRSTQTKPGGVRYDTVQRTPAFSLSPRDDFTIGVVGAERYGGLPAHIDSSPLLWGDCSGIPVPMTPPDYTITDRGTG